MLLLIQIFVLTLSAQRVVTGVVTDVDAENEPLIAATIAVLDVKGNPIDGATTDIDGKFTLTVSGGEELTVDCTKTRQSAVNYRKEKTDAGLDFLTTQMFFSNDIFYNFLYRAREAGITVPIIAGIMPITSPKQLSRSVAMSGTDVPQRFRAIVDYFGESPAAMAQAGIVYATEQIIDLIANGVRHIHVYTMNKPAVAAGIMKNLSEIL